MAQTATSPQDITTAAQTMVAELDQAASLTSDQQASMFQAAKLFERRTLAAKASLDGNKAGQLAAAKKSFLAEAGQILDPTQLTALKQKLN